jgi:hypothetical protein
MTALYMILAGSLFACMALRLACACPRCVYGHVRSVAHILIAAGAFWALTHPHVRSLSEYLFMSGALILFGVRWPRARQ